MIEVLTNTMVIIVLQYMNILNQCTIHVNLEIVMSIIFQLKRIK